MMPSLFEGLPFVLVEAQAAGLPCVVSSAVSKEANVSGKLRFVGLDDDPPVWADVVIMSSKQGRYDAADSLIEAGYSISNSAQNVASIIAHASH